MWQLEQGQGHLAEIIDAQLVETLANYATIGLAMFLSWLLMWLLCIKPVSRQRVNSFFRGQYGQYKAVFGHRGAGFEAPENTMGAIRHAKRMRVEGVEIDFDFSGDGHAVVIHDSSVDRTCNGTGLVAKMSLSDLRKLNAAHYWTGRLETHSEREALFEQIPTLDEVVQFCLDNRLKIMFDLKGGARDSVRVLCRLFDRYPQLYDESMVSSFYPWSIYLLRRANPRILTGITWQPYVWYKAEIYDAKPYPPTWKDLQVLIWLLSPWYDHVYEWLIENILWRLIGNSVFLPHADAVSKTTVHRWEKRGIQVFPFNCNSAQQQQHYCDELNVPYITDWPSLAP